jgi:hypothetical protein
MRIFAIAAMLTWCTMFSSAAHAQSQSEFLRGDRMPYDAFDKLTKTDIEVSGGVIHVGFAPGDLALPKERILDWVRTSARAVSTYYGCCWFRSMVRACAAAPHGAIVAPPFGC